MKRRKRPANEGYLPRYYARQARWCRLGVNIGYEQDGTGKDYARPVLILKGFSRRVCLVIPLTTSSKENRYHFPLGKIGEETEESFAITSQLRLIDTRRLDQVVGVIDKQRFEGIRKAVKDLL